MRDWKAKLSQEQQEKVMKNARASKKNFIEKDMKRGWQKFMNNSCKNGRQDTEKQAREYDTRIEKEQLTGEITHYDAYG